MLFTANLLVKYEELHVLQQRDDSGCSCKCMGRNNYLGT